MTENLLPFRSEIYTTIRTLHIQSAASNLVKIEQKLSIFAQDMACLPWAGNVICLL